MSITWILVANASRARLMRLEGAAVETIEERTHDASRAKGSELLRDDRGRTKPRNRDAQRGAAMAYSTPPKEIEAERFARGLAEHLRLASARNEYDDLVLVAPPEFLGVLRAVLDGEVAGCIRATVAKDYTRDRPEVVMRMVGPALGSDSAARSS